MESVLMERFELEFYIFGYGVTILSIKYVTAMYEMQAQKPRACFRNGPQSQVAYTAPLGISPPPV